VLVALLVQLVSTAQTPPAELRFLRALHLSLSYTIRATPSPPIIITSCSLSLAFEQIAMWLLNTRSYELKRFFSDVPRYAILSHTWGVDEPTFDDLATGTAQLKAGYQKIEQSCARAAESDISHIWIDTICIDKRSSSELSEAINSMYRYYERSYICYA
jgi:hypothetical protein